jgi:hypothetical protein
MSVQYPGEKEITFPPYTCLEADGDPRVQRTKEGEIIYFPLKVAPPTHPRSQYPSCSGRTFRVCLVHVICNTWPASAARPRGCFARLFSRVTLPLGRAPPMNSVVCWAPK